MWLKRQRFAKMAFKGSSASVADNTGIKTIKILQVYQHPIAVVGDVLLGVIRKKKKLKAFVKKKVNFVFLFSRRQGMYRPRGAYYLRLLKNRVLVLTPDKEKILGTRHAGFLTLESKRKAFSQLLKTCRVLV